MFLGSGLEKTQKEKRIIVKLNNTVGKRLLTKQKGDSGWAIWVLASIIFN